MSALSDALRHAQRDASGNPLRCKQVGKVIFSTRDAAERAVGAIADLPDQQWRGRIYRCPGTAHWHYSRIGADPDGADETSPYWRNWAPQHADLAIALLAAPGGQIGRAELNAQCSWGPDTGKRNGHGRVGNAIRAFERRGWVRRDGDAVIVLSREALGDLIDSLMLSEAPSGLTPTLSPPGRAVGV